MSLQKNKNGKIELLRFAFSVVVMLFHMGVMIFGRNYTLAYKYTVCSNGYFGVEFFFVLSGFLMASYINRLKTQPRELGKETWRFVLKKVLKILPLHIIAFALSFIIICIGRQYNIREISYRFLYALPNLFFVMRSGFKSMDVLTPEWYICQMFLSMLIIYPLCRKYYKTFSRIVAPLIAVFFVGYLIKTTGSLSNSTYWLGFVSKSFVRAVGEICAGVFAYEVCCYIDRLNFKKSDRIFLSIVEVVCWLSVFAFTFTKIDDSYAGHFLMLLCIALCLTFSNATYGDKRFNNKFCFFLGSLSLNVYLLHPVAHKIVKLLFVNFSNSGKVAGYILITLALCLLISPLEKKLGKAIAGKIKQLKG